MDGCIHPDGVRRDLVTHLLEPTFVGFRNRRRAIVTTLAFIAAVAAMLWTFLDLTQLTDPSPWSTLATSIATIVATWAALALLARSLVWRSRTGRTGRFIQRWSRHVNSVSANMVRASVSIFAGASLLELTLDERRLSDRPSDIVVGAGLAFCVGGLSISGRGVRRAREAQATLRGMVDDTRWSIRNGEQLSADRIAELRRALQTGLGTGGSAIPIVDAHRVRLACHLLIDCGEIAPFGRLLEEVHVNRLGHRPPEGRLERAARINAELASELRSVSPTQRPGPVQVFAFRDALHAENTSLRVQLRSLDEGWCHALVAESEAEIADVTRWYLEAVEAHR